MNSPNPRGQDAVLAACPFCGGAAWEADCRLAPFMSPNHAAGCDNCAIAFTGHSTRERAIAAWNRRATPASDEAVGDALRDAVTELLAAQDAVDNHEAAGINADDYFALVAHRNAARRQLTGALGAKP